MVKVDRHNSQIKALPGPQKMLRVSEVLGPKSQRIYILNQITQDSQMPPLVKAVFIAGLRYFCVGVEPIPLFMRCVGISWKETCSKEKMRQNKFSYITQYQGYWSRKILHSTQYFTFRFLTAQHLIDSQNLSFGVQCRCSNQH